jgi:4a-hydroxytetrahydrobiopterin dehydratase
MIETLTEKKCTPCRGGVPRLTLAEAEHFRSQTPNWELRDDGHRIERTFHFSNFRAALNFVRGVGELAETEGHHPDVSFGWGYATISLRTDTPQLRSIKVYVRDATSIADALVDTYVGQAIAKIMQSEQNGQS